MVGLEVPGKYTKIPHDMFGNFLQNATSETRIKMGSGDRDLRKFRIKIDAHRKL
jgi:hypothetical protein